jgi:hypothetical protein
MLATHYSIPLISVSCCAQPLCTQWHSYTLSAWTQHIGGLMGA